MSINVIINDNNINIMIINDINEVIVMCQW